MQNHLLNTFRTIGLIFTLLLADKSVSSQIIITQYYEGAGVNKWIELSNVGSTAINTASPQLKLGLWSVSGSTGNIAFAGSPTQTVNLTITIPAFSTVLIGNTGNGTEVTYLNSLSAAQNSNSVINFNGNDGIALLDASNNVIDRFGTGINAAEVSYVRSNTVTGPSTTYQAGQWTSTALTDVQNSINSNPNYLGFHFTVNCTTPASQPSNLIFSGVTNTSATGTFSTTAAADEYLIVRSNSSVLTQNPIDGTTYYIGNTLGNGTIQYRGPLNTFTATGLNNGITYYFFVFSIKSTSCSGGPKYRITSPLSGSVVTTANCPIPSTQPTTLVFNSVSSNSVQGSYTNAATAEQYLILRSLQPYLSTNPVDGVLYEAGNTIGNHTVVYRGSANNFLDWGLDGNTTYFYRIFSAKTSSCIGGIRYRTSGPLKGYTTTLETTYSTYFGNLHSHSELSDGVGTASGNLGYADAALCMDYLGISDHNHNSAGMTLANWNVGVASAKAYSNSTFCALYGMEWGTIAGGGHVIVYGTDSLLGWDTGEYNVFVPQNNYTGTAGLFSTLSSINPNAFATLAHPNSSDFDDLDDIYSSIADNVMVGCAVENGPSTSISSSYDDYPASMAYLSYFRTLLARGYHVGPTIDHDNHNITHGRTAYSRTAVLSASIHRRHILDAFKQRRFYATHDCGAYVNFQLNGFDMGSILTMSSVPKISVSASTSSPITSIKLYSGIPGSGVNANQLTSTTNSSLNYTHTAIPNLTTRYYYADITEADGKRIITSPIWFTRNDNAIPVDYNLQIGRPSSFQHQKNGFSVFPNPATDQVQLQAILFNEDEAEFHLYDLYGKKMLSVLCTNSSSPTTIILNMLKPGLYIYQWMVNGQLEDLGKLSIR